VTVPQLSSRALSRSISAYRRNIGPYRIAASDVIEETHIPFNSHSFINRSRRRLHPKKASTCLS